MIRTHLTPDFSISRIVHGHWRLNDWNLSPQELLTFSKKAVELGVTTIDHAAIYGDYSCEKKFGEALKFDPSFRKKIEIVTKCGLNLISSKFIERTIKHYDFSYQHIVSSAENSLKQFGIEQIDVLLLHRPSPLYNPHAVARAFTDLKNAGKVAHFGVSNFTPQQFSTLNSFLTDKLITNQIELSPYNLEHFDNGNIDFLIQNNVKPMAWSPLAGGKLLTETNDKALRIQKVLAKIAKQKNDAAIEEIAYSWLLKHPVEIIPIVGSGKFERLTYAVNALQIDLSTEEWFEIYQAIIGKPVA
jgi:predicted oxidoreductase